METTKPFQVLAIDGGGIRGLYSTALLHSIAAHFEPNATDGYEIGRHFDLIAGTSTGGILACGLGAGKTTKELIALYREIGQKLFVDPQPDGTWATLRWAWRNLTKGGKPFGAVAACAHGHPWRRDARINLCTAQDRPLPFPPCRLHDWTPKVFKTPHSPNLTRDRDVTLVDACMATSAAPIFLPVAEIVEAAHESTLGRYVDGGLWANNPVLIAMLEAIDLCTDADGKHLTRPIVILAVGTSGGAPGDAPGSKVDRGMLGWKFGGEAAGMSIEVQGVRLPSHGEPDRRILPTPRLRHLLRENCEPQGERRSVPPFAARSGNTQRSGPPGTAWEQNGPGRSIRMCDRNVARRHGHFNF